MDAIRPWFGRYFGVMFLTWGALVVAGILLGRFAGVNLPGGGVAVIPPMIAGLHIGQKWAEASGDMPPSGPAWQLSAIGGGVYALAQAALFIGVSASLSRVGGAGPALPATLALLAVLGLIAIPVSRFFMTLGARGVLRQRR